MKDKILSAIKELKKEKRKFSQTFDLIINLREFDIKKPENKLNEEINNIEHILPDLSRITIISVTILVLLGERSIS